MQGRLRHHLSVPHLSLFHFKNNEASGAKEAAAVIIACLHEQVDADADHSGCEEQS